MYATTIIVNTDIQISREIDKNIVARKLLLNLIKEYISCSMQETCTCSL